MGIWCTTEKHIYYTDLNTVGIKADSSADLHLSHQLRLLMEAIL